MFKVTIFCAAVIVSVFFLLSCAGARKFKKIKIRGQVLNVELAVNLAEKQKGLGYRNSMPENNGMLFVYDYREKFSFWMKGMRFPLDFVWIDSATVADITTDVPIAKGYNLQVYSPAVPVDKILELNAGTVKRLGISKGDTVSFVE